MEKTQCLIVGGGPAGLTAAIYLSRAGVDSLLLEGPVYGGQLTTTTLVENFPGFPQGIQGPELMDQMHAQAQRLGSRQKFGCLTDIDLSEHPFKAVIDGDTEIECESVIICTGATAKYLGLPSEERFKGMGVSACATCDGFFYRGRDVAVVGGGDTACEEATYLASLCHKVYMIVRRDVFRASEAMQKKVFATENIEVLWNANTLEVLGDDCGVTGARLLKEGKEVEIRIDGFFLAIGHHPCSELFGKWVATDSEGYVITKDGSSRTSVEGVFAAGDVCDPNYRQAIVAAGAGCKAAMDAIRFLRTL